MKNFDLETFLSELETLVNIDSGYGAPDGATQTALLLAEPLRQQGWLLERHRPSQTYGEVIVLKNREAEHYDVLMIGHTDTVFPAGEATKRPFTRDEKRAYGVGVLDMKQGCLAAVYALKNLPEDLLNKLNIAVVFNPDEETGSPVSKEITDEIARRTTYGLVFEAASVDTIRVIRRKGMMRLHVEFIGKAGHAGYAFENGGINAVNEMAHWICELSKYHREETGTTVNAGLVSGGQAVNIIPDHAELSLDIRYSSTKEMERIEAELAVLAVHAKEKGVGLIEKKRIKTPPMEPCAKTEHLCTLAQQVSDALGLRLAYKHRGGLSDANHISACGCATLDGMGPTGDFDHSEDEYLELSTIEPNIDFAYNLLCKIAEEV